MRLWLVAVLILSAAACSTPSEQQHQQTYDSAKAELWRGDLAEASTLAERGLEQAGFTAQEFATAFR